MIKVATRSATSARNTPEATHHAGWILRRAARTGGVGGAACPPSSSASSTGSDGSRVVPVIEGSPGTIGVRLSTLIICLVVAGTAIALLTRVVTGEMAKPATDAAGNHRATPPAVREIDEPPLPVLGVRPPTALQRVRSAVALVLLLGLVGALAALAVGALVLLVVGALRHAVG